MCEYPFHGKRAEIALFTREGQNLTLNIEGHIIVLNDRN